jgi:hypothetical protein
MLATSKEKYLTSHSESVNHVEVIISSIHSPQFSSQKILSNLHSFLRTLDPATTRRSYPPNTTLSWAGSGVEIYRPITTRAVDTAGTIGVLIG